MKTMLWKFYFWVVLALDMTAFIMPQERRIWETFDMGFFLVALIGLFGFCWGKQMVGRVFWQIFFVGLLSWIGCYVFILTPVSSVISQADSLKLPSRVLSSLAIIPHIPLIAALYLYSFRRSDIWQ
jgi:hypothetical protein